MSTTEPEFALKSSLAPESRWEPIRWSDRFVPKRTRKVADEIERKLGTVQLVEPPERDLQKIWSEIREIWVATRDLAAIPARTRRWIGWTLFFPPNEPELWLGSDRAFVESFLAWVRAGHRDRYVIAALRSFFQAYPVESPLFETFREQLRDLVYDEKRARLARWRERALKFDLLELAAPDRVASQWLDVADVREDFIESLGFSGTLESSKFLSVTTQRMLKHLSVRLRRLDAETEVLELLSRSLDWLADGTELRFGEWRIETAEALLTPFVETNPTAKVQARLRTFLLEQFGDPRIGRRRWSGVSEHAIQVMFRWLVKLTLDAFFRLLDDTALDRHWRYRKVFWSAYLKADAITDAWLALGPSARRQASRNLKNIAGSAGSLSGVNVLADHSVLLFKLRGATVAEWSHSGTCRFWLDGNRRAPKMYRAEYTREELLRGADFEQRHHGPERGHWQDNIAGWIHDQLRIQVPRSAYLPRRERR